MSCADTCVVMDYEASSEFYREAYRHARKPYKCCECGDAIAVGSEYQYATGKTEGHIWQAHTCLPCSEVRQTFCCAGWSLGELWESIRDQLFVKWDEMKAIDCLARLASDAAIAKMREEYADYSEV